MIINAVIESKDGGTLVLDFPRSIYDVYEKLQSVGIRKSPYQITLSDEEGDVARIKLYSKDEVGKHLLLTLNEQNSLADANLLAFMVDNAKADFRSKLEQNLLHDQYGSMQEVTDAIKQMLYESGPVKAVFYCPLVGEVTDDESFSSPVDGRFLKSYAWAVENALEADTADDEMDMAEFFDEDDGVKAKLVSAKWGVETYRGRLFGRIECSLKEELTDAETEILTDWISGQNSDGYGEHFEQQPIDTEDGDLYVSFWNSGDNYSIMTRDELDEYMPFAAIIALFNGDINIDTDRLQTLVVQNMSAEEQARLQRVEDLMLEIEEKMTAAGFDNQRVKEAQVLFVLALSDFSEEAGFVDKLVGCFADGQSDADLIAAVNAAFGTDLSAEDFTKVMSAIRAVYISTAGYVEPSTKNNLDLVEWAKNAYSRGWGYVWGTYGQVLTRSLYNAKAEQYPDEVGGYADFIEEHWIGGRTADCVGLIKGYGWFNAETGKIEYGTNGMDDKCRRLFL